MGRNSLEIWFGNMSSIVSPVSGQWGQRIDKRFGLLNAAIESGAFFCVSLYKTRSQF